LNLNDNWRKDVLVTDSDVFGLVEEALRWAEIALTQERPDAATRHLHQARQTLDGYEDLLSLNRKVELRTWARSLSSRIPQVGIPSALAAA
jgi:hypothetical protein